MRCIALRHQHRQLIELRQDLSEEKAMMGREAPTERLRQDLRLGHETASRECRRGVSRSVSPATSASSIARPDTPSTSLTTFPSLILAPSSSLWTRLSTL